MRLTNGDRSTVRTKHDRVPHDTTPHNGRRPRERHSRTLVDRAKNGRYQWRLKATNGRVVAVSLPQYSEPAEAERALEELRGDASGLIARASHVKEGMGWIWVVRSDRGQPQARSMRSYERYATCRHAFEKFIELLDDATGERDG